ncbi:MAG: hypothetical protein ABI838_08790 [Chloroflexota bacterium]
MAPAGGRRQIEQGGGRRDDVRNQDPGQTFYEEQVDYLVRKDVDGLIDNHYAPDAN